MSSTHETVNHVKAWAYPLPDSCGEQAFGEAGASESSPFRHLNDDQRPAKETFKIPAFI